MDNLKKEVKGALAYVLGPISGIFFLVVDKDPFVRFHAMQSTVVFVVFWALQWILSKTIFLFFISVIVGIISFVLWLVLIYRAWQGDQWEVPVLGKLAKNLLKKV